MPDRQTQSDPKLPERLVEELRGLQPGLTVPAEVDRAVLGEARAGYARRRRFWLAARAVGAASAAAAAAVVVLVLYLDHRKKASAPVAATQAIAGDVDGNGRVDILDAFVLARKVEAKAQAAKGDDVNGDGVIDRRDVDAVAGMAVSVQ
jgi:hypothetical protein